MKPNIMIAALFITGICACQKNDTPPANATVAITLNNPQDGQVFHTGDTVFVNADISYPGELHGYEVKITDTASGLIIYDNPLHVHDDHFTVQEQWINTSTKPLGLKLEMITALNDNGHDTEKVIHIFCQP
jgi:hypothetical protein